MGKGETKRFTLYIDIWVTFIAQKNIIKSITPTNKPFMY